MSLGGMGGADGVPGGDGVGSGGDAMVPLRLQSVCGIFAVPFWQGWHLSVSFLTTIARCLSIAALALPYPANTTRHLCPSRTSARGDWMRYYVNSIAVHENSPLVILARFNTQGMLVCSSCTRPPCPAIVADMLKAFKRSVAASKYEIRLLPEPYTVP